MSHSTLMLYDSIEGEPSPPNTKLQFEDIRRALHQEGQYAGTARGCFGNCQTALLELPNIYFFVRAAHDPGYLNKTDKAVLTDFARFLGGPPELLVPAWSCLRLGLDQLPADLPAKLWRAELKGKAAQYLPGGPPSYLKILAAETDSHRRLLQACNGPAKSEPEAAQRMADGVKAIVDWWKLHGYTFDRDQKVFAWEYVWGSESGLLFNWVRGNKHWPNLAQLAAEQIVRQGTLPASIAKARVDEALGARRLRIGRACLGPLSSTPALTKVRAGSCLTAAISSTSITFGLPTVTSCSKESAMTRNSTRCWGLTLAACLFCLTPPVSAGWEGKVAGAPDGWGVAALRDEIRPGFAFEPGGGPDGQAAFLITADDREGLDGAWVKTFPDRRRTLLSFLGRAKS